MSKLVISEDEVMIGLTKSASAAEDSCCSALVRVVESTNVSLWLVGFKVLSLTGGQSALQHLIDVHVCGVGYCGGERESAHAGFAKRRTRFQGATTTSPAGE